MYPVTPCGGLRNQSMKNKCLSVSHQAVPLYSLAQSIVVVRFQQQAVRQVLDKVQVFVNGNSLFSLLRGGSSLIGGALQVIFEVHGDDPRQKIVHHYNADILAPCLNTIQSVELGQQGALVLVYILERRRNMERLDKDQTHLNWK